MHHDGFSVQPASQKPKTTVMILLLAALVGFGFRLNVSTWMQYLKMLHLCRPPTAPTATGTSGAWTGVFHPKEASRAQFSCIKTGVYVIPRDAPRCLSHSHTEPAGLTLPRRANYALLDPQLEATHPQLEAKTSLLRRMNGAHYVFITARPCIRNDFHKTINSISGEVTGEGAKAGYSLTVELLRKPVWMHWRLRGFSARWYKYHHTQMRGLGLHPTKPQVGITLKNGTHWLSGAEKRFLVPALMLVSL